MVLFISPMLYLLLTIGFTCFQMIQGYHRVLVITVQKCKCYIFQLVLLWFYRSHRYLYSLIIISFCLRRDSEWYSVISGNSGTPFRKVSALYCKYYYYGSIYITDVILITYHWVSMLESIFSTKNKKQHSRGTIWHTRWDQLTAEIFEVQADCWERDCFSVGIQPVPKWLSLIRYSTQIFPSMITIPWDVVLTENQSRTYLWIFPVFHYPR